MWKGIDSCFTLVQNRHAAARDGDNLVAQHALYPVSLHVFECEPREVAGAGGDAAEGVLGHTFHRKSGYELHIVLQIVGYPHIFDG